MQDLIAIPTTSETEFHVRQARRLRNQAAAGLSLKALRFLTHKIRSLVGLNPDAAATRA